MSVDIRLKVLPQVEARGHRYVPWRYLSQLVTVAVLLLVPITGLTRIDLYGGEHRLFFKATDWRHGLAGVIVGIALMYVVTFLINIVAGRMFCGWGCPVGFLNRLCDVSAIKKPRGYPRWKALRDKIAPLCHSFILVWSCLLWWTDHSVFVSNSFNHLALAWGTGIVGIISIWALGRWARWRFCMTTCPIGLYYSFVAPSSGFGVYFREATSDGTKDACLHCNACINVCPVDLDPMNLMVPASPRGGLAVADAPGNNHCLKCGDCIQACEMMIDRSTKRRGITDVPLLFGWYEGEQRVEFDDSTSTDSAATTGSNGKKIEITSDPLHESTLSSTMSQVAAPPDHKS